MLFCGAWDEGPGYPRTTSLRRGLEQCGIAVRECRLPGLGITKKALLRSPWRWPGALLANRAQRRRLRDQLRLAVNERRPRCIVVPYPGHAIVDTVRAATDVPVVLDLFLSAYDTVVEDRRIAEPGSLLADFVQGLETRACAAADLVLLDTPANAAYVASLTGLPAERFHWLPVDDPDAPLAPSPWRAPIGAGLRILFFGTGVPLHGLATLIDAIERVPAVELTLVGGTSHDRARAQRVLGTRLRLEPTFVDRTRLGALLDECQLVAGVFGSSGKAQRVVPFKLVHALAAGRPVVTADTPAVNAWLDGSGACFTTPAGDVEALAHELEALAANPQRVANAAAAARPAYDRHFSTECTARRWRQLLERIA